MIEECIIQEFEELYKNITLLDFNDIEELFKQEYNRTSSPIIKRRWKNLIYSWDMAEYKKERIWEYMNNDITKEYFDHFVEAVHKGWFK